MSTVMEQDGFVVETSSPAPAAAAESSASVTSPTEPTPAPVPASADASPQSADGSPSSSEPDAESSDSERVLPERAPDGKFKKGSIQERINRAVWEREEAKREAARLRDELERTRAGAAPTEPTPQAERQTSNDEQKPRLEQFQTYEDYVEAVADWKAAQRLESVVRQQQERQAREAALAQRRAYAEREASFRQQTPDYETVMTQAASLPLSPAMEAAILASDRGPQLAYFLAAHPEDAVRLAEQTASLPGTAAPVVRQLLEALVTPPAAPSGPATGATRPTVPPPIKPVGASPVVAETPPDALEFGPEYVAKMNALERQKLRAARGL